MDNTEFKIVKVISGELFPHLSQIRLFGRIDDSGDFIILGCHNDDQQKFYSGILEYDKQTDYQGFETVEDVEKYWIEVADMILFANKGDYEIWEDTK